MRILLEYMISKVFQCVYFIDRAPSPIFKDWMAESLHIIFVLDHIKIICNDAYLSVSQAVSQSVSQSVFQPKIVLFRHLPSKRKSVSQPVSLCVSICHCYISLVLYLCFFWFFFHQGRVQFLRKLTNFDFKNKYLYCFQEISGFEVYFSKVALRIIAILCI